MKVAVIGASGFVGSHIVKELAGRGHQVLAIARNTSSITPGNNVTTANANVNDVKELTNVLQGSDAVVSAFNAGWANPDLYEDFLSGSRNIEKAVEASGVKRLIVVGGAGSLLLPDGTQLVDSPEFPAAFKQGATAARDYLNELKQNDTLDWTFFSPAIEMSPASPGTRTGKYRTASDHPVFDEQNRSRLSVEDLAVVIADELEQNSHLKQRFTAGY
ncbi:NAD(P)-dependent oxidoreductase [Niabella aquatica]